MSLSITPLFAGLIALIYLTLCWRVISYRKSERLSIGDEGDRNLLRLMRAQANCAEYAPFGLFLLLLLELQGQSEIGLFVLGTALTVGRILHAYSFSVKPMNFTFRTWGMLLTLGQLITSALWLLGTVVL